MIFSKKNNYQVIIKSDLNELVKIEQYTEKLVNEVGFSEEDKDSIAISITELVSNAITHGNNSNKNKNVTIDFEVTQKYLMVSIQDEGGGFNLNEVANPLDPENLLKDSGRGIHIVRSLMDSIEYKNNETGSLVKIIKKNRKK